MSAGADFGQAARQTLFRRLTDLSAAQLAGKRVLIRADLNAPMNGNVITEDTRLRASLPAIHYALNANAAVMVVSHRGRPTPGQEKPEDTLAPVADYLSGALCRPVPLIRNWVDHPPAVEPGDVVLLENCRLNAGEKQNDEALSRKMAAMCDVYVNDAFGIAHRTEATTVGIARFAPEAVAGPLLAAELDALNAALRAPKRPLLAIVGGAKVSTKLTVLRNLADKVDSLIVGGGIANTFLLATGHNIGKSLAEPALVDDCKAILEIMAKKGGRLPLPVDVVVAQSIDGAPITKAVDAVDDDDLILDVGPRSLTELITLIDSAETIVWNGPMGLFENDAFAEGTRVVAKAIANAKAFSVAGGGDTLAAIAKFGVRDGLGYVSTGGGAFLEFLEGRPFPAVEALEARAAQ